MAMTMGQLLEGRTDLTVVWKSDVPMRSSRFDRVADALHELNADGHRLSIANFDDGCVIVTSEPDRLPLLADIVRDRLIEVLAS